MADKYDGKNDEFVRELSEAIIQMKRNGRKCTINQVGDPKTLKIQIFEKIFEVCPIAVNQMIQLNYYIVYNMSDTYLRKGVYEKYFNDLISEYNDSVEKLIDDSFDCTGDFSWRDKREVDVEKEVLEICYQFALNSGDKKFSRFLDFENYELISKVG